MLKLDRGFFEEREGKVSVPKQQLTPTTHCALIVAKATAELGLRHIYPTVTPLRGSPRIYVG
jgi:hypothetical protein